MYIVHNEGVVRIVWKKEKNALLKRTRGVTFEDVLVAIDRGDLLGVEMNGSERHQGQEVLIVIIHLENIRRGLTNEKKDTDQDHPR